MKNLLYSLLFIVFSGLTITACTEEVVTPDATVKSSNGGGQGTGDSLK